MYTLPVATTGWVRHIFRQPPRSAFQSAFGSCPGSTRGTVRWSRRLTMLRDGEPPNIGHSPAGRGGCVAAGGLDRTAAAATCRYHLRDIRGPLAERPAHPHGPRG